MTKPIGFKTNAEFEQSWLQGEVDITYADLVAIFGPENSSGDDYKVQAEWSIKFADGIYATIYDWKQGKNYCGPSGISKKSVTGWHIGGSTKASVTHVMEVINHHRGLPRGRTVEEALANSQPLAATSVPATELGARLWEGAPQKKAFNVDMRSFRNVMVESQNAAIDLMKAIEKRDGSVPRDKLIEYTVRAAEAAVLSKVIQAMDKAVI